jgi:MoxR-like ATPase
VKYRSLIVYFYLSKKKKMNFENITDLVNKINEGLGKEFCNSFQYKRKELGGFARIAAADELFRNIIKEDDDWSINKGGGTEVQYHIALNEDEEPNMRYGLGFNTQFVPFAGNPNEIVDLVRPFMNAFLQLEEEIKAILPGYDFIHGSREQLQNPQFDQYTLLGKKIYLSESDTSYTIDNISYEGILSDLKKQFIVYIKIFELRNKMLEMSSELSTYTDLFSLKPQIILQGPPGTGKTHTAKSVAYQLIFDEALSMDIQQRKAGLDRLEQSDQFKLIQFHPAYSYEDLIRGISAKTNGTAIEYKTENRKLADFALKATENYLDSLKEPKVVAEETWIDEKFELFKDELETELEEKQLIPLTKKLSIVSTEENGFQIESAGWDGEIIKYSEIKKIYKYNIQNKRELSSHKDIVKTVFHRTAYYFPIVNRFRKFLNGEIPPANVNEKRKLKKYVLIIDEINRANLPAVLGELIYALEYRGENVESMYDIEGDKFISLPSNLYIIGTMNTADRSTGHIDYAIRRRFAFKNVLPDRRPIPAPAQPLFEKVSELFIKNFDTLDWADPKPERSDFLATDFRPEDVWIGHSYFLSKKDNEEEIKAELQLKLKYEITPLLAEYLKDGLLLPAAEDKVNALYV